MKISVCIPMYNESAVIADNAKRLWEYMEKNFVNELGEREYEIIYSNDGSTDGCDAIVRDLSLPGIIVAGYDHNQGKGFAVKTTNFIITSGPIVIIISNFSPASSMLGRTFLPNSFSDSGSASSSVRYFISVSVLKI